MQYACICIVPSIHVQVYLFTLTNKTFLIFLPRQIGTNLTLGIHIHAYMINTGKFFKDLISVPIALLIFLIKIFQKPFLGTFLKFD